jgi:hypothetical protein
LLLSREEDDRTKKLMEQGDAVSGHVGDGWSVPFEGHVVHARKQSDGWQYGLSVEMKG